MLEFHHKISSLALSHEWSAVLKLILKYHVHIATKLVLDPFPWENIPDVWISKYCMSDVLFRPAQRPHTDDKRDDSNHQAKAKKLDRRTG